MLGMLQRTFHLLVWGFLGEENWLFFLSSSSLISFLLCSIPWYWCFFFFNYTRSSCILHTLCSAFSTPSLPNLQHVVCLITKANWVFRSGFFKARSILLYHSFPHTPSHCTPWLPRFPTSPTMLRSNLHALVNTPPPVLQPLLLFVGCFIVFSLMFLLVFVLDLCLLVFTW